MIGCIVCDMDDGYCEFCPEADREVGHVLPFPVPFPATIKRSYVATYRGHGTQTRRHMFIGPDSFLEAVYDAEGQCDLDEQLLSVTEMT